MKLGERIAEKRKEMGMTQIELAEQMHVTRQTISRWEAGTVYPDVEKVSELASILHVSCDYLLTDMDDAQMPSPSTRSKAPAGAVTRLLQAVVGKKVKLSFYDDEINIDLAPGTAEIIDVDEKWVLVHWENKKKQADKLIRISSIKGIKEV